MTYSSPTLRTTIINTAFYDSPCGRLMLATQGDTLCMCDWICSRRHAAAVRRLQQELRAEFEEQETDLLKRVAKELDEYFRAERKVFEMPLSPAGTAFQHSVWRELQRIPYGKTLSYAELAAMLGRPAAVRAVANAVGANPISIIVPCHRIVGSNHSLTGYAGGLEAKRMLLEIEKSVR